jgi:hypothetical protein
MLFWACATAPRLKSAQSTCPAADETAEDCPWAGLARDLAPLNDEQVSAELRAREPELYSRIEADSRLGWTELWGQSINYDELAHGVIIDPKILRVLHSWIGAPMPSADAKIAHAGTEHTYGYLFSNLKTPFGFKRARWVEPAIDQGFALNGAITPLPKEGSLFSNVTYFTGRIAFRNEPDRLAVLKAGDASIPASLKNFDYGSLHVTRLVENLEAPRKITIRTDFVPFTHAPTGDANSYLLIYSVIDGGPARLITAFPIKKSFVKMATDPAHLGKDREIITRYNGEIEGVSGKKWKGSRVLE